MKKKWFISSVIVLIALIFTLISLFANTKQEVSVVVNSKNSSASRYISNSARWRLWWPGAATEKKDSIFHFKGNEYKLIKRFRNGANLTINPGKNPILTQIRAFYKSNDSTLIQWEFQDTEKPSFFAGIISRYKRTRFLKEMAVLMDSFKLYMNNPDKVYRFHIVQVPPIDTLMITTKRDFANIPTTNEVYNTINYLRSYLNKVKIVETGVPMMNIGEDSGIYKLMVAIPIERSCKSSGDVEVKRMVPSKFVSLYVEGGPKTLEVAKQEAKLYMTDYEKVQMAIPFESLITDRLKVADTAKWQTRIYYPSF